MENLDKWRMAGHITAQVREYGASLVVKGASYKDICEKIELKIKQLGGQPAFPPQMSLNDVAAHFHIDPDEDIILSDELVCLDVGVHVDGCIGDTAITVDLSGKHTTLVEASKAALAAALKTIDGGEHRLGKIGKAIDETIRSYGFVPIRNLSGHGLEEYEVHSDPTIPNYDTGDESTLPRDAVMAIEPFATTGVGLIYEVDGANLFSQVDKKGVRSLITREVLKEIEIYRGLPFASRWLTKKFPLFKVNFALKELLHAGIIRDYAPLVDKGHGLVSQAEHTIYIDDNGKMEILTK